MLLSHCWRSVGSSASRFQGCFLFWISFQHLCHFLLFWLWFTSICTYKNKNQKKPADFPFAWLFECGPFQPPWWISRCSGEGNTQQRMYTTHAEPLRFILRLYARPVSQRCFLITCSHMLSVLCTFVRLILKQKEDGEELKLIQPNWLITSWKSFLYSLNVPWFPLPTRCPLPGRDKVCRLLSYLAYS